MSHLRSIRDLEAPSGLDPQSIAAANAAHDARYGFNGQSFTKLQYPPY